MQVDLNSDEIALIVEGLDCLKTKIAFTKGLAVAEKNERLRKAEALEQRVSKLTNS